MGTAGMTASWRILWGIVVIMLVVLGAACGSGLEQGAAAGGNGAGGGLDANGCVVGYDGSRDLFPTKATFQHARTLSIDYHNSYKVVTVQRPWPENTEPLRYVLVHCGTAAPALSGELAGATVIEVPVRRAAVMTTTVLPYFERFDAVARIVGVNEPDQVNTPTVIRAIESTAITETGQNEKANLETLTSLDPDVIVTVKQGDPAGLDRLRQAGFTVVVNGSTSEDTALGRNEYETKLIGALLNREADAERSFTEVDIRYTVMAQRAAAVTNKPTVYAGQPTGAVWNTPGGLHWQARLFQDAGADFLYSDQPQRGSLQLDLEAVLDKAGNADFWFQNTGKPWETLADARAEEPRLDNFAAFREGRFIGLRTFQVKGTGENDFWEQGVSRPDLLLEDIISVIHPELAPGHQLRFFRVLPAN
ncbi:MAG: ABC transporter substrate-binding protein [Acidimicrobiales bacterium]